MLFKVRQEELEDLDILIDEYCELPVAGGAENAHGKVNILMQTYLSRGYIKCLSLASDMEYITQVCSRIKLCTWYSTCKFCSIFEVKLL